MHAGHDRTECRPLLGVVLQQPHSFDGECGLVSQDRQDRQVVVGKRRDTIRQHDEQSVVATAGDQR